MIDGNEKGDTQAGPESPARAIILHRSASRGRRISIRKN
jgi:hypothetical protein